MSRMDEMNAVMKHAWSEPRFVAEVEWMRDHPGLSMQLEQQLGRAAMEQYATGGDWPDPEATVTFVIHEPPDWDWWEPTTRWRRIAARDREFEQRRRSAHDPAHGGPNAR